MRIGHISTMYDGARRHAFDPDGGHLQYYRDPQAGAVIAVLTRRIAVFVHLRRPWRSELYWDW